MSDQSNFERLKTTPVTELNLGSASIRRVIKHAGFDTLPKLLDLSEKDIDALFEWRDADVIIELRERYRANLEELLRLSCRGGKSMQKPSTRPFRRLKPPMLLRGNSALRTPAVYYSRTMGPPRCLRCHFLTH